MSLPNGYKRLEYIQSSGTQYVNTEYIPNQNTRVVAEMEYVSHSNATCSLFGSGIAANGEAFETFYLSGNYYFGFGSANYTAKANVTTGKKMLIDLAKDRAVYDIGGTVLNLTPTASQTFTGQYELLIHAMHRGGSKQYLSVSRTYSFKIYDNGTLVRDFVPCQNASGVVGLWDAVNGVFYGNAGTGVFTAGSVVPEIVDESEITELEYIQSSGTQYLDTLFKPSNNTRVTADFEIIESTVDWACVFGAREESLSRCFALFTNSNQPFYCNIGGRTDTYTFTTLSPLGRHFADVNKNEITIDGISTALTARTFQNTSTTIYFCSNNEDGTVSMFCKMKWYSCQIYDNGLLERDYIPAMLENGEVGLYDRVFQEFYRNAGTGAFIPGNPIGTADITPTMTSNTTPEGYTASQSSAHGGLNAWYAFDGVDSTENNPSPVWHSNAGMPQWVMLQFPEAVKVTFFSIKNRGDVDSTYKQYGPKAFELQGSHDGADFVPLGSYTSDGALGATGLYRVQNPGRYQYYRVYVTEAGYVYNNQQYAVIDQIRFYEPLVLTPEAPANFRVESETDTLVTLAWDEGEDAMGYRLYRHGQLLADITETSVSVAVEPFAGAVFTVTAYNENGEGAGTSLNYFSVPENPILFLVTDRTQADVTERNAKGYYAASDLNRVGYAVKYLAGRLRSSGVSVTVSQALTWTDEKWATPAAMTAYLKDVQTIRNALKVAETTPVAPEDMAKLTYSEANDIEAILVALDVHIKRMLSIVDAGWASGLAYTGFYAKEAY